MRRLFFLLLLLPAAVQAHVGSPNVFFDGEAGSHPVRVIVRPPEVVPGVAEITVRLNRRTYSPILRQAGIPDTTIPWWGNRTLHFEYH